MRVIIVGCGRVGARVAAELDQRGEHVTVIDINPRAFNRLPQSFGGETVRGSGTDEDVMRTAGAEQADLLMTLTEGDNRNVMAAQIAMEKFNVEKAVAKINDPVRAAAYADLGIATVCRTTMLTDAILGYLTQRPTGMPSVIAPVPHVHDEDEGPRPSGDAPRLGAQPVSTPTEA